LAGSQTKEAEEDDSMLLLCLSYFFLWGDHCQISVSYKFLYHGYLGQKTVRFWNWCFVSISIGTFRHWYYSCTGQTEGTRICWSPSWRR
jgi:hypothetical protein